MCILIRINFYNLIYHRKCTFCNNAKGERGVGVFTFTVAHML